MADSLDDAFTDNMRTQKRYLSEVGFLKRSLRDNNKQERDQMSLMLEGTYNKILYR